MKKIERLDIGHVRQSLDNNFKIKISEIFDDVNLETDFPHRHNFYMVCLVIRGSGIHVIDFEKIDIIPNRIFFLKPEQVHFWDVSTGSKFAVLQFSAEFLSSLFPYDNIPAIHRNSTSFFDIPVEKTEIFYEIFKKVETESSVPDKFSDGIIQAQTFILLNEIERLISSADSPAFKSNKFEILNKFKKLLNDRYKEVTSISGFASLLNITPNYLNIIVKETIGTTANNLMHERIILEAKRLLIQKNSDITQIAYDLGFKDASYFARFFKRFTGQSPSDFRSEIYKKYLNQNN
jgi:AraC family transcriptional activator of pobA